MLLCSCYGVLYGCYGVASVFLRLSKHYYIVCIDTIHLLCAFVSDCYYAVAYCIMNVFVVARVLLVCSVWLPRHLSCYEVARHFWWLLGCC